MTDADLTQRVSDYTYEEFVQEFQEDVATRDVFKDDVRAEAEHEILDGGTYQVGRVPDKQYLTVWPTRTRLVIANAKSG